MDWGMVIVWIVVIGAVVLTSPFWFTILALIFAGTIGVLISIVEAISRRRK